LRGSAAFRRPLDRFICTQLHEDARGLTRRQALDLARSPAGRLAILLVSEPVEAVERASLLVCAAAFHRQVLSTTALQHRELLRMALGREACQVAVNEAPVLYPELGACADEGLFSAALAKPPETARVMFTHFGHGLLASAAAVASRWLAGLSLKRLPAAKAARKPRLSPDERELLLRLLERRMPSWSLLIV